ncbi:MAG: twin-arginine translocase subunit TatC [Campylobacterales bacterium]
MTWEDLKPHLEELARRSIYIFIGWIPVFIVAWYFWKDIYFWMATPLLKALKEVGVSNGDKLIFTHVTEAFTVSVKVGFFIAFVFTFPNTLYQIWKFVAPALKPEEKEVVHKFAFPFLFWGTLLFLAGVAFAYYVVFPISFKVLLTWGGIETEALPKMKEYLSFFLKTVIAFGLAFNLPVYIYYLAKLDLINGDSLRERWRQAVVFIFIIAAIFTPPDIFSQFLLAIPLLILFWVSILIADRVAPSGRKFKGE